MFSSLTTTAMFIGPIHTPRLQCAKSPCGIKKPETRPAWKIYGIYSVTIHRKKKVTVLLPHLNCANKSHTAVLDQTWALCCSCLACHCTQEQVVANYLKGGLGQKKGSPVLRLQGSLPIVQRGWEEGNTSAIYLSFVAVRSGISCPG